MIGFAEVPVIPEIDLAFAISTSAANADKTFTKMKNTVNAIITKYGMVRLRYAIIPFGTSASTALTFQENSPTPEQLKSYINLIPRRSGEPNLKRAFDEVKRVFDRAPSRPNSKKVLVVIVDDLPVDTPEEGMNGVKGLERNNIKVVPVVIGDEVDPDEVVKRTNNKQYLVKGKTDENPEPLGNKIMDKVLRGKIKYIITDK